MSILPAASRTDFTALFTLLSSVTSIRANSALAMGAMRLGSLTVPNTRAPRSARSCAVFRPIPEETPVINATLFAIIRPWFWLPRLAKPACNHQRFASYPGGILRGEKDSGRRDILCLPNAAKWGLRFQLLPEIALVESGRDYALGNYHSGIDGVNSNVARSKLVGQRPCYGIDRRF